jgi:hypothetical protein
MTNIIVGAWRVFQNPTELVLSMLSSEYCSEGEDRGKEVIGTGVS